MLENYLKIALRNLRKNKFFTFLNVAGLAVGLACCMLIALYLYNETHYDRHHARAGDLYLVGTTFLSIGGADDGEEHRTFNTPSPMGAALKQAFPEIEKTARTQGVFESEKTLLRFVENGTTVRAFNEPGGHFADSSYFDLFHYEFAEGSPVGALNEPQTLVLSEEIAQKLFGGQPAYGRTVRVSNNTWFEGGDLDFRVTGVVRLPAEPTHLKGRFFMSMNSGGLGEFIKNRTDLATNNMFYTYLLLRPGSDGKALEAKLPSFVDKYISADLKAFGFSKKQFLTALPDVHLADLDTGTSTGGGNNVTYSYLYILGSIALFTLLIACVNFMNLSTARSAKRASEVGVRKSVGASRGSLVAQFLGESVLIALLAFVLALGLTFIALPFFNQLTERALSLSVTAHPGMLFGFFGMALLTGLLAGAYPAFYLSSFQSVEVLKGRFTNSLSAAFLRKGLVVFQFVISAGLILASLVIASQMKYLQSKDLGFERERQIVLPMLSKAALAAYQPLKNELQRDSRIAQVGASQYYPGIANPSDAGFRREGQTVSQSVITRMNWVDHDFLPTLGVRLVAGRLFSPQFPADTSYKVIVNEVGIKKYGFASPAEAVGQKIMFDWQGREFRFEIIGVIQDFHFESLHQSIEPYVFQLNRDPQYNYLLARAKPCDLGALLASIQKTWSRYVPGEPCEYSFLDEDFQKNYKTDTQMASLVSGLTGIAILISCLGLLGLAAFAAEQRTREIGIRKVLGASVAGITGLLATDFLKLVFVAIVLASPLAYYFMQKWLTDFAYRIEMQWWMFALAGCIAVVIAFLTVGFQAMKAALINPAQSLKGE